MEKLSLEKTKINQGRELQKETPVINLRDIQNYTACIKLVLSSMGKANSHKIKHLKIKYMISTFKKFKILKINLKNLHRMWNKKTSIKNM